MRPQSTIKNNKPNINQAVLQYNLTKSYKEMARSN